MASLNLYSPLDQRSLVESNTIVIKALIGGADWKELERVLTMREMGQLMQMREDAMQDMRDGITPMVMHLWLR